MLGAATPFELEDTQNAEVAAVPRTNLLPTVDVEKAEAKVHINE